MDTPTCTIPLEAQPLDCCVSPSTGLLAAGLVSGQLQLATFSCPAPSADASGAAAGSQLSYQLGLTIAAPGVKRSTSSKPTTGKKRSTAGDGSGTGGDDDAPSCRAVAFAQGGDTILAGYSDQIVRQYDVTTGKLVREFSGEHDQQLSRVYGISPGVFASGDEEGLVVLWDTRAGGSGSGGGGGGGGAVYRYTQHTDYITDFALHERDQALVVTSGDATLSVHDLRKRKALARSEDDNDDELLSCVVVKGGKKVVAGTQSGVLNIYSWGYFNDCSDRFPGHPESVQAMVAFDEDTVLTGSSDGGVRVVGVLPNRLLGILGQHNEDFPVERLALSHDRRVLASTSHDSAVKLWDLSILHDDDGDGDEDGDGEGEGEEAEEAEVDIGAGGKGGAHKAAGGGKRRRRGAGAEGEEQEQEQEQEDGKEGDGSDDDDDDEGMTGSDSSDDWWGEDEDEGEEGEEGEGEEEKSGSGEGEDAEGGEGQGRAAAGASGKAQGRAGAPDAQASGAGGSGARAAKGAAPGKAVAAKKGLGGGSGGGTGGEGGKGGDGGSDAEDSDGGDDDDSDSDGGAQKRKRAKRERTKWTKGAEQRKQPAANFFADIL